MKNLFAIADEYLRQSDWRDLALIKFCLFSMGVLAGVLAPKNRRKLVVSLAAATFVVTYPSADGQNFSVLFRQNAPYSVSNKAKKNEKMRFWGKILPGGGICGGRDK